jgi:type II restriction enzyme MunI
VGTNELRKRTIWQDISGGKATVAEKTFFSVFTKEFEGTDFRIRSKPKEFKNIYSKVVLSDETRAAIYSPDETWVHGMAPDYAIDNTKTGKILYVEVKRQDGWVEGKTRSAGRGNAHERSNKLFTPGLMKLMREHGKISADALPFWVVFQGDIARDPKRVREITFWYGGYEAHFFLWSDSTDAQAVINHFNKKLRHLLT